MLKRDKPTFSFEFYPPKTEAGREAIWSHVGALAALGPSFMTVTYGAGGSTRQWTAEMAARIQRDTAIPTAAHLTCVNTTRAGIREVAESHWENGIRHIVALRGDVPPEDSPLDYRDSSYYHYADELIEGLRGLHPFEISVAAYPEKHPEAPDMDSDIANLKRKCEAGAARAITQFFFDNDVYCRFLEKTQRAGIQTPIVPGLLPIVDFDKMLKFATASQTSVPPWLGDLFAPVKGDLYDSRALAQEILTSQCRDLIRNGAKHLHFYTLNQSALPIAACKACGLAV